MKTVKHPVEFVLLVVLQADGTAKDHLCILYREWHHFGIGFGDLIESPADVESAIVTVNLQSGALSYHKAFVALDYQQFLKRQLDHFCLVVYLPVK